MTPEFADIDDDTTLDPLDALGQRGEQPALWHCMRAVDQIANSLGALSIFEFGCRDGLHLSALRRFSEQRTPPYSLLAGIDSDADAAKYGRLQRNLDTNAGDAADIRSHPAKPFDISFTLTSLSGVVAPERTIADLAAISGWVILIEPTGAKPAMVEPAEEEAWLGAHLHDYRPLLDRLALPIVLELAIPTTVIGPGSLCRLFLVRGGSARRREPSNEELTEIGREAEAAALLNLLAAPRGVTRTERLQSSVEMIRLYRQTEKQQNIRAQELKKIRDEARQQAKEIKNSIRYRLGTLIIRDLRRPWKLPLLPLQLVRLYLRRRGNQTRFRLPDQQKLLEQLATTVKTSANADYAPIPGRVCYVLHNSLPYASGGYATRSHGLLKGLIGNGVDVVAVTRPGFPQDTIDIANKDILPHVIDGVSYSRIRRPHRNWMSTTEYMRAIVAAFERKFRELRPALVQAASFHISAMPAQIAARRLGIPFVYEIRGLAEITKVSRDPTYLDTDDYRFHATMEAECAKAADHVFTLTGAMKEEFVARGVARDKITLLPNSCDPAQFSPLARDAALAARLGIEPDVPVIGYIGSIVDYEGLEDLVEACGELRQRGPKFRLLIVGSEHSTGGTGPITREMRRLADAPGGLGDWLILTGRIPYAEVESYYSLVDISPFPRKPWPVCEMVSPMKPLEALATEKAVVVSSVAALKEMVQHDETGLVFEKGDAVALAEVLARLIADPALRSRLGKAGRAFVERERSWHATAGAGAALIRDLLAHPPERIVTVPADYEAVS